MFVVVLKIEMLVGWVLMYFCLFFLYGVPQKHLVINKNNEHGDLIYISTFIRFENGYKATGNVIEQNMYFSVFSTYILWFSQLTICKLDGTHFSYSRLGKCIYNQPIV